MKKLEARIKAYSMNPDNIQMAYAMLKVGRDKGDDAEAIMQHLLAHVLLDFNGIPVRKPNQN